MNIEFMHGWDHPDNNAAAYNDGWRLSRREVFVIMDKILRANIWCVKDERGSVEDFIKDMGNGVRIDIKKGAHRDRYARDLGLHITAVIASGCRAGATFHLYGSVTDRSWKVDFIGRYNPRIDYRRNHVKLQNATAPRPVIEVINTPFIQKSAFI